MAFEKTKLFRLVELDIDTAGLMTLTVSTDQPGDAITARATETFNTELTTTGRRTERVRLPGHCRGRLIRLRISGAFRCRLYGARVYAKVLGPSEKNAWGWFPVPVEETPLEFGEFALPIEPTPEDFGEFALPIVETPEDWLEADIPIPPTPLEPQWVSLPMDE